MEKHWNERENDRTTLYEIMQRMVADEHSITDIVALVGSLAAQADEAFTVGYQRAMDIEAELSDKQVCQRAEELEELHHGKMGVLDF